MSDEYSEAQFTSDSDSSVVRCPYCKHEYQPEAADYSEDTREEECFQCDKKFWVHQDFSVDHVVKPDCELNGEQHKWRPVPSSKEWLSCAVCDKWRLQSGKTDG